MSIQININLVLQPLEWCIAQFTSNILSERHKSDIYIYIYIYIIIISCHNLVFPWLSLSPNSLSLSLSLSLATRIYRPSFPAGLPLYILYKDRAVLGRFLRVTKPSVWRVPHEYITHKFVFNFPAESRMSCSSNLDGFQDEWYVVVHLPFWGFLRRGFVQIRP